MSFKPGEFFFGLVDFIAILLPGSLLAAILLVIDNLNKGWAGLDEKNQSLFQFANQNETAPVFWVSFAFASFGLGYFLSSISSGIDVLFDKIRAQLYPYKENLIEKIRKDKGIDEIPMEVYNKFCVDFTGSPVRRFFYFLLELEWKIKVDNSFDAAKNIMIENMGTNAGTTNTYKWSLAILDTQFPGFAEQVNKTMAASKFFRSLVVVFSMLLIFKLTGLLPPSFPWWPVIVFLVLSFREYIVQRLKSIQATYRGIITLYHLPEKLKGRKD